MTTQDLVAAVKPVPTLPANPLADVSSNEEYHRRIVNGILESYNSNYDVLAEAVQNAVDAVEDAQIAGTAGPYYIQVHINLAENWIGVLDTGVGLEGDQIVKALAPNVSFKAQGELLQRRPKGLSARGYKGVGLTFLAYGTDELTLHTKAENSPYIRTRMRNARTWASGKRDEPVLVEADDSVTPLDAYPRGTYFRVCLSSETRPKRLSQISAEPRVWETILRTRTAIGQVLIGTDSPTSFSVDLIVTDTSSTEHYFKVQPEFLYPHSVIRQPAYRFLNVTEYWARNPERTDIPTEARRRDGLYIMWDTERIRRELKQTQHADVETELSTYQPTLYAFLPYQASVWAEMNEMLTGAKNRRFLTPGLIVSVNRQRLADLFEWVPSRFETTSRNLQVVVHFVNAKPDLGRKTLQEEVLALAKRAADRALQYLARQRDFMKPPGEAPSPLGRDTELNHADWLFNVRMHASKFPIDLPPVTYRSQPLTEQDVVGLFHQLSALGVFPGLQVFATSQTKTYDCLIKYECPLDTLGLRYVSETENPLGVSPYILGTNHLFETKHLTLEFKNNLDGLVGDIDGESKKDFLHIDVCVCWSTVAENFSGYILEVITEDNLDERRYPGVTHLLRKDGESHVVQVMMLKDVVDHIATGHVQWSVDHE